MKNAKLINCVALLVLSFFMIMEVYFDCFSVVLPLVLLALLFSLIFILSALQETKKEKQLVSTIKWEPKVSVDLHYSYNS